MLVGCGSVPGSLNPRETRVSRCQGPARDCQRPAPSHSGLRAASAEGWSSQACRGGGHAAACLLRTALRLIRFVSVLGRGITWATCGAKGAVPTDFPPHPPLVHRLRDREVGLSEVTACSLSLPAQLPHSCLATEPLGCAHGCLRQRQQATCPSCCTAGHLLSFPPSSPVSDWESDRKRERASVCGFSLQMAVTARPGSAEAGGTFRPLVWMQGPESLDRLLGCIIGSRFRSGAARTQTDARV